MQCINVVDVVKLLCMFYDVCLKMIVEEKSVVAAKIDLRGNRLQPSFRLPLRTKIELHFFGRWKRSKDPPDFSRWDGMAEEVNKAVYREVTGCPTCLLYHLGIP